MNNTRTTQKEWRNALFLSFLFAMQSWKLAESFLPPSSASPRSTSLLDRSIVGSSPTSRTRREAGTALSLDPKSLLYAEQERLLVQRGKHEGELLANGTHRPEPLEANVVKGASGGGGFGGGGGGGGKGGSSKKNLLKAQAKSHARVLKERGVVRIDDVLPADLADFVRGRVYEMRVRSEGMVESGSIPSLARFADVLLKDNRCDMTIPLGSCDGGEEGEEDGGAEEWVAQALASVLVDSPVGPTIQNLLGSKAVLREWSCLMSDPSSNRQVMHPDTPYQKEPVLYTCFIALQDIRPDMGPTTWMPGTHESQEVHDQFRDDAEPGDGSSHSAKDRLLLSRPTVLGTLEKGSCAIFDSRLLHAGGANVSETSRAILYCTFQNPKVTNVGNPGSIRKNLIDRWTLQGLQKELVKYQKGKPSAAHHAG